MMNINVFCRSLVHSGARTATSLIVALRVVQEFNLELECVSLETQEILDVLEQSEMNKLVSQG